MNPIERGCRALAELHGRDPDEPVLMIDGRRLWQEFEPQVSTVIAALREPSDEMMSAAHQVEDDFDSAAGHRDRGRTYAQHIWPVMIDAMLEEGSTPA